MEMGSLLAGPACNRFLQIMSDIPDFQAGIMLMLLRNPLRPYEMLVQELCEECGPRNENDTYEVTEECKGCGKEKTLEFY